MTSEGTARAQAHVAAMLPEARGLGEALAALIDDPAAFGRTLQEGLERLSDPAYAAEQERVAPGSGEVIGVRWPLWRAVARGLREPLASSSSASAISLAQVLAGSPIREIRLFATVPLAASLAPDPERSWQIMRRLGRAANDWISVDSMADLVARGILLEPFRWAELEQLVYSPQPWERRLVGSTIARLPFQVPTSRRPSLSYLAALDLVALLIGDAQPQVQKSLSWALREWTQVDRNAVRRFLEAEARAAALTDDGHRAWVLRDALGTHSAPVRNSIRARLASVRKRNGAPPTSRASVVSSTFAAALGGADGVAAGQGERMAAAGTRP